MWTHFEDLTYSETWESRQRCYTGSTITMCLTVSKIKKKYLICAVWKVIETRRQTQKDNVPLLGLPIFLLRNSIADRKYNTIINRTLFTYTKKKEIP